MTQFTIKTISQKKTKNKGKDNIFIIGFTVIFITHNIIHHIIYVFHHHTIVIHISEGVFNKYVIKYKINEFINIENIIFIVYYNFNKCIIFSLKVNSCFGFSSKNSGNILFNSFKTQLSIFKSKIFNHFLAKFNLK